MYDSHFKYIKKTYGDRADLCFTDIYLLFYDISTEDVYVNMENDHHYFDFSDYPEIQYFHNILNEKVVGI